MKFHLAAPDSHQDEVFGCLLRDRGGDGEGSAKVGVCERLASSSTAAASAASISATEPKESWEGSTSANLSTKEASANASSEGDSGPADSTGCEPSKDSGCKGNECSHNVTSVLWT